MKTTRGTLAAIAAASTLALTGCSFSVGDESSTRDSSSSSSDSGDTSGDTSDSGSDSGDSSADVPDGYTLTEVTNTDLSVAVPEDWSSVDAESLSDLEPGSAELDDYAKTMGMSADQLTQALSSASLIVKGDPEGNFSPNITFVPTSLDALPTEDELQQGLAQLAGGSEIAVEDGESAVGSARIATVTSTSNDTEITIEDGYVETEDGVVLEMSVSSSDAGQASEIMDVLLETLQPTS